MIELENFSLTENKNKLSRILLDIIRRLNRLEKELGMVMGFYKTRRKEIYYSQIILLKEHIERIEKTIEKVTKETLAGKGFANWWIVWSKDNPVLQNLPDNELTINYSSLKSHTGRYLPSVLQNIIVLPIVESDRLVYITGYTSTCVKVKPSVAGSGNKISFVVLQYAKQIDIKEYEGGGMYD